MENIEEEPHPPSSFTHHHHHKRSHSSTTSVPIMPFAELLTSNIDEKTSVISGMSSTAEEEYLRQELSAAKKRIEHFTQVRRVQM